MKRLLALSCCVGLAVAQFAHAADNDQKERKKARREAAPTSQARPVARPQYRGGQQRAVTQPRANAVRQQAMADFRARKQARRGYQNAARNDAARNAAARNAAARRDAARNAERQREANRANRNAAERNRTANRSDARRDWGRDRGRNWHVRNRNSYADARRHHWHDRHDRRWWRDHYTRFALFAGGYYYWNSGYWYPAYGYSPAYSTYIYDEPIYGYGGYDPGQVVANVQAALERRGYRTGGVDGLLGPATRDALARFQADYGLIVTRAIDEPTLEVLGLS